MKHGGAKHHLIKEEMKSSPDWGSCKHGSDAAAPAVPMSDYLLQSPPISFWEPSTIWPRCYRPEGQGGPGSHLYICCGGELLHQGPILTPAAAAAANIPSWYSYFIWLFLLPRLCMFLSLDWNSASDTCSLLNRVLRSFIWPFLLK